MRKVLEAMHDTVLENNAKNTAAHMPNMRYTNLLQRANPDNNAHNLTFQQAVLITKITGDIRTLRAWAELLGCDIVKREKPQAVALKDALFNLNADLADVFRGAREAKRDGVITGSERKALMAQLDVVEEGLRVARASVEEAK